MLKLFSRVRAVLLSITILVFASPSFAALNILATTPEWGALAAEIGGDKVSVYIATTALQDVHRVEARPSLMARARNADLLVATGADLEVGWLPCCSGSRETAKFKSVVSAFSRRRTKSGCWTCPFQWIAPWAMFTRLEIPTSCWTRAILPALAMR